MPVKILSYLLRHCFVGLALSATTVIGFTYFLILPGTDGNFSQKFVEATQQLMLISHLIMPLVVLIGVSYGLGLLHNHSEFIAILQSVTSFKASYGIVVFFCALTLILEILYWPTLRTQDRPPLDQWHKTDGDVYFNDKASIRVRQGKIAGVAYQDQVIGTVPTLNQLKQPDAEVTTAERALNFLTPNYPNKKLAYQFWRRLYQACWPVPLFFLLWMQVKRVARGSSAANITAVTALTTIAAGLLSEASYIVLSKAMVAPPLTLLVPALAVAAIAAGQAKRLA